MDPITIIEIVGVVAMSAFGIFIAVKVIGRAKGAVKDRPRERLVEIEAWPERPFELEYVVEKRAPLRLFLVYNVHSQRTGGTVSRGITGLAGLAVRFDFFVDGAKTASKVIGQGSELPCEVDYKEPLSFGKHVSTGGSDYHVKATMPVVDIGPRPAGTKLSLKGTVLLNQFTDASELTLFLSTT